MRDWAGPWGIPVVSRGSNVHIDFGLCKVMLRQQMRPAELKGGPRLEDMQAPWALATVATVATVEQQHTPHPRSSTVGGKADSAPGKY